MNGKRKKSVVLVILTVIAGIVGIGGYMFGGQPPETGRYYIRNSGGAVMFDHAQHTQLAEDCADCHHTVLSADDRNSCSTCHDDEMSADYFEHADLKEIHAQKCTFCHNRAPEAEPQPCQECHPKAQPADNTNISCSECHDDSYTKDLLTHDEMQQIEAHSCDGCHNSRSLNVVYHEQCTGCHLRQDEEKFATKSGEVNCNICHLK